MVKKGYRVESDTLGPVEIPEKALWGPQTQRSKDNFHTGALMPIGIIRALLQIKLAAAQANIEAGTETEEKGRAIIEAIHQLLDLNNEELHLTPIEYKLLCLLTRNIGKVLTHTFLTQSIWGSSWDNDIASLRVFMATLRKKIEKEPNSPQYIQTHIGVGYRMLKVD